MSDLHVKQSDTNNQLSPIYAFLYTLPASTLGRIHQFPASCLAIFRLLPTLARLIVSHLLWIPNGQLAKAQLVSFVRRNSEGKRTLEAALVALEKMHIVLEYNENGVPIMAMDDTFRRQFRLALTGGGNHRSFGITCSNEGLQSIDVPFLDSYARKKWEAILHFMVGSKLDSRPGPGVLYLLSESGLMVSERQNSSSELNITSKGFQFLLDEMNSQIWHFLIRYLGIAEQRNMDLVEILSFLFMLGGLELGRPYSAEYLTQTQKTMLQDLSEYGLIYQPPQKEDTVFFPTRIAITLTSSSPPLVSEKSSASTSLSKGQPVESPYFILITTNYRLYAYTSNPLQVAVLNLFVSIKSGFSNFVVGMITRESIKSALANGIEADQIISYLSSHAHPQMRLKDPVLPPNVVDQIHLWEQERMRTRAVDGYLYEDFQSDADFELVRNYAQQIGVLLWSSEPTDGKRQFVVTDQGHSIVREFIRRRMES